MLTMILFIRITYTGSPHLLLQCTFQPICLCSEPVGAARGHYGAHSSSRAAGGQALTCSPSASKEPARTTTGRRWRVQAITRHHGDLTACSCSAITKVSEWLPRKGCGQWVARAESKPREVLATDLAKPIASLGAPSRSQGSLESKALPGCLRHTSWHQCAWLPWKVLVPGIKPTAGACLFFPDN